MSTEKGRLGRAVSLPPPVAPWALDRVPGVLGRICRERAADLELVGLDVAEVLQGGAPGNAGRFRAALEARAADGAINVIAEVKRSSPSQGAIAELDPVTAARQYVAGGAAAISVLTEPRHFGGSLDHLAAIADDRATWDRAVPVLRKDFTVHPLQLLEAADAGADAILVIVAVTGDTTRDYVASARDLGMDALVEVHDADELEVALAAGADVIGVNNRDLRTLAIDLGNAPRLIRRARELGFDGVTVAESGYRTREDLEDVIGLADAVLVGTSLAGSGDLTGSLRRLADTH